MHWHYKHVTNSRSCLHVVTWTWLDPRMSDPGYVQLALTAVARHTLMPFFNCTSGRPGSTESAPMLRLIAALIGARRISSLLHTGRRMACGDTHILQAGGASQVWQQGNVQVLSTASLLNDAVVICDVISVPLVIVPLSSGACVPWLLPSFHALDAQVQVGQARGDVVVGGVRALGQYSAKLSAQLVLYLWEASDQLEKPVGGKGGEGVIPRSRRGPEARSGPRLETEAGKEHQDEG